MSAYQEIVALREIVDDSRRGYLFETAMREIMPWAARPPLAVTGESEQIDAFFEWNSWHFIVEAKAKKCPIKRGSHDWEDFELKVRKRRGSCIGLFCSLFPVSDDLLVSAEQLNREGLCTLLMTGSFWEELVVNAPPFDGLLRYMIFNARSRFKATPGSFADTIKWLHDAKATEKSVRKISRSASMPFLRRFAHPRHEEIYVERDVDRYISALVPQLKPSVLARKVKMKHTPVAGFAQAIEVPPQIVLIRDSSGAGKTTLAANLALSKRGFVGITRTALDSEFDNLPAALATISEADDCGIAALAAMDMPIVYTIDSLDEAMRSPSLNAQIRALFKSLDELNELARQREYRAFPICLLFTVREEYWRYFQAQFDGRELRVFANCFSIFSEAEFKEAFRRYLDVYEITVDGDLPKNGYFVLATPFNLQVFAEAFQYSCVAFDNDILVEDILGVYFKKKRESAVKRQIPGFTDRAFMQACSAIAFGCVLRKSSRPLQSRIVRDLEASLRLARFAIDDILLHLRSEQILRFEGGAYSFRHMRYLEYLAAYFVVAEVAHLGTATALETRTKQLVDSGIISIVRVHDYIEHITRHDFPEQVDVISTYYARSKEFLRPFLTNMRNDIAICGTCGKGSLQMVVASTSLDDPKIAWDAFHVIAAKSCMANQKQLLDAFEKTWERNLMERDHWKLLLKLSDRGCMCHERVFIKILESRDPKDWEVFLGAGLRTDRSGLERLWAYFSGREVLNKRTLRTPDDWRVVEYLAGCLENKTEFVRGKEL